MFNRAPKPRKAAPPPASDSAAPQIPKDALNTKRDRESARSRTKSAASREIGPLPACANPDRRESCRLDLERFCLTYFPATFPLPFCPAHKKAIAKLQAAIINGGLYAFAMPRGGGKSTLTVIAAVWAEVYGHRRYICLIGATEAHAEQLLATIKAALTSDQLAGDFPEICAPIRAIENDARRCTGQIVDGVKTAIVWTRKKVVLPTIKGSLASGSVVSVAGITGRVRGQNHTLATGEVIRPDFVIPDDPQTRESAWSDSQCNTRYAILHGDVLGLAGPGKKIAAVVPCTVIRKGDLADRLLDRQQSPEWQGERSKMLTTLPTNEKLWEQYAQLRADALRADGDGSEATEFYKQHQVEMDAGACATWPERFNPDELSAIQHAMNLKLRNEEAFAAEAQNEPIEQKLDVAQLKPEEICQKLNGLPRGAVPLEAQKITAFIDVQEALLYWMVCAWDVDNFGGWVLDYGTFPEQPRRYFTLRQASPSMQSLFPGLTIEAQIRKGLESLCGQLFAREFRRTDGAVMPLNQLLIDQGHLPAVIQSYIRSCARSSTIMPSKGVGISVAKKPMSEYRRQPGEQLGTNWTIPKPQQPGELRHVRIDTNHWKSFVHTRLALPTGTNGAITLYGKKSGEHRLLADQLTAEFGTPTEGHGRKLVEWRVRPGGSPDNHWLDGLVGCAVGASIAGCGEKDRPPAPKRRQSYRNPVYIT